MPTAATSGPRTCKPTPSTPSTTSRSATKKPRGKAVNTLWDTELREITVARQGKNPLHLITNDLARPATEIAELYKERWQIELFFKWVKQNLKIKTFLGRSESAVKIQIYTALIAFILLRLFQNTLFFGIYPYVALAVLVLGTIIRYDREPYTWRSGSSQLLRRRQLVMGSVLLHVGLLIVFFGHLGGLLTPIALFDMIGISHSFKQMMAIAAEVQNHPADTPDRARSAAALALVVRELLLQRAREIDLKPHPASDEDGRRETDDEALIRQLLDKEVTTPDADEAACRRFHDNNRQRFQSPDLFQAAHVLFSADPADKPAYVQATEQASALIAALQDNPGKFAEFARTHSACPSAAQGGNLGQVTKGQTVPEFETFLFNLEDGQLCPVPVKTRYGVHVLRLDRRIAGKQLPFEHVRERIADYLVESSWRLGIAQYIRLLAGQADIRGIALDGADNPLVQ